MTAKSVCTAAVAAAFILELDFYGKSHTDRLQRGVFNISDEGEVDVCSHDIGEAGRVVLQRRGVSGNGSEGAAHRGRPGGDGDFQK